MPSASVVWRTSPLRRRFVVRTDQFRTTPNLSHRSRWEVRRVEPCLGLRERRGISRDNRGRCSGLSGSSHAVSGPRGTIRTRRATGESRNDYE
jgi:hypothetical protein